MKTNKLTGLILICLTLIFLVVGCEPAQVSSDGTFVTEKPSKNTNMTAERFQDTPLQGKTAVESAIDLSEKYTALVDEANALHQENQELKTELKNLTQENESLQTTLAQSQKELNEANELLIQMLSELNTWKSNILGFREEMKAAATAQLQALIKILELLGGEQAQSSSAPSQSRSGIPSLDTLFNNLDSTEDPNGQ